MASSQGDEFDVSAYTVFDSFEEAMEAAAKAMPTLLPWNEWQKLAAAVRAKYPDVPMDKLSRPSGRL